MFQFSNVMSTFFCSSQKINPDWVKLITSRGYESNEHKLFMRYTGK